MITTNKDLRRLLEDAEKEGWKFKANRNHIKGKHIGGATITMSRTPSDYRAVRNIKRDFKYALSKGRSSGHHHAGHGDVLRPTVLTKQTDDRRVHPK
jgi:hypothetical protein